MAFDAAAGGFVDKNAARASLDVDIKYALQTLRLKLIAARRSAGVASCYSPRINRREAWPPSMAGTVSFFRNG